jgi:hypothetical protein
MSNIIFVEDEECLNNIDIDELYDKNMRREQKSVSIFNKILNRIHKRILTTSRMKYNEKHIWFIVPTFIFGQQMYDQGDCVAHCVGKLTDNGFHVKYMHPNALFISWQNWIPSYVRTKYKKKTGIVINEKGEVLNPPDVEEHLENEQVQEKESTIKRGKQYTEISKYSPSGKLVYNPELFYAISGNK